MVERMLASLITTARLPKVYQIRETGDRTAVSCVTGHVVQFSTMRSTIIMAEYCPAPQLAECEGPGAWGLTSACVHIDRRWRPQLREQLKTSSIMAVSSQH